MTIDWRCLACDTPQAESTALSETSAYAEPDADFNSELPDADFNLPAEVALDESSLADSPRPTIGLPPRPRDLQLHQKDDGPAVPARKGDRTHVRDATQGGVGATSRVRRLRIQHLDPRKHPEPERLDLLHAGCQNQ